jgi:hypothetical protein
MARADPDEVLSRARLAMRKYESDTDVFSVGIRELAAEDLVDAFGELDMWLSAGGYMPDAWKNAQKPTTLTRVLRESLTLNDAAAGDVMKE